MGACMIAGGARGDGAASKAKRDGEFMAKGWVKGSGTVLSALALMAGLSSADAAEISLAGVIGTRAILVVDGGAPQTLGVGARSREGIKLLSLQGEEAVVEFEGERQRLRLGERVVHAPEAVSTGKVVLNADSQGHFWTQGKINGGEVRFLVDTGASMVALGRSDARRLGLNYTRGTRAASVTANGVVATWRVRLDTVEIAGVRLHNVDAMVHEGDLPVTLLGMSALSRMRWQRDGQTLTLEKIY